MRSGSASRPQNPFRFQRREENVDVAAEIKKADAERRAS